jgi:tRNA(Ile)-lysidine synthase
VKTQSPSRGLADTAHVLRKEHHSALRILKRAHTPYHAQSIDIRLDSTGTTLPVHEVSLSSVARVERSAFHEFSEEQRALIHAHSTLRALLRTVPGFTVRAMGFAPDHSSQTALSTPENASVQSLTAKERDNAHRTKNGRDNRERDNRERDNRERDNRERDNRERDNRERDNRERDNRERDNRERNHQEKGESPVLQDVLAPTIEHKQIPTVHSPKEQRSDRKSRKDHKEYQSNREPQRDILVEKENERLQYLYRLVYHAEESAEKSHAEAYMHREYYPYDPANTASAMTNALPHVARHAMITTTDTYLTETLALPSQSLIVCAISGGADSIAMLDVLVRVAQRRQFRLHIVHCNHQLRAQESSNDALFVREVATRYGLDCTIATFDLRAYARVHGLSIEHSARSLRYACFATIVQELHGSAVCTAHTSDDSAETFLLNLMRGSGLTGLSGMKMHRNFTENSALVRPLLHFSKEQILTYNQERGLPWREDSSNSLMLYTRNKIRHKLLPFIKEEFTPAIHDVLARTATILSGADEQIQRMVARLAKAIAPEQKEFYTKISCIHLGLHDRFTQGEIIQHIATGMLSIPALPYTAVDRILELLHSESGAEYIINKRWSAFRERDHLVIAQTAHALLQSALIDTRKITKGITLPNMTIKCTEILRSHINLDPVLGVEYFDAKTLPRTLTLRRWKPDDIFQPLGMTTPVSLGDFLAHQKIPLHLRSSLPVLAAGNDIIWVAGIRISERYKLQPTTVSALRIEIQPLYTAKKEDSREREEHTLEQTFAK